MKLSTISTSLSVMPAEQSFADSASPTSNEPVNLCAASTTLEAGFMFDVQLSLQSNKIIQLQFVLRQLWHNNAHVCEQFLQLLLELCGALGVTFDLFGA